MTHPSESDVEAVFVRAAAEGDAVAWRQLIDANAERVASIVRWRCAGLPDLAADVIQQTWLEAARNLRRFDPARGSFSDWVGGITRRVILAEVRKWRRYRIRHLSLASVTEPGHLLPDPENAEAVVRVLAELPDDYEAVLRAKYLDRQSVQAIADANGQSTKAVESRLTRARDAFRTAYLRWQGDES
jgi:RNA polymerase sigma-70 factor, ECF subfamily